MHLSISNFKHFSHTLFSSGSMLMGLYALGNFGSLPGFGSKFNLAIFHLFWNLSCSGDPVYHFRYYIGSVTYN